MLTYAEIHFRPQFLPSLIHRREPEILIDAPRRIEPGGELPVTIISKDADRYPIHLTSLALRLTYAGSHERILRFPYYDLRIDSASWFDTIRLIPEFRGRVEIEALISFRSGHRSRQVRLDNYRRRKHTPLSVYVSPYALPGAEGWFHGDMHCHSDITNNPVEFGAPVDMLGDAARALGLHWFAVTDHSYDFTMGAWASPNDPPPDSWVRFRETLRETLSPVTILPGEEASCRTRNGGTAHLLAIGAEQFIPGSGDGGRQILSRRTELTVADAITRCRASSGIALASHPFQPLSFPERLVLNRSTWSRADCMTPGLSGLQIHNGARDPGFSRGLKEWTALLLKGFKLPIFAGNDAHGDLNRRRAITWPLVAMEENATHVFGMARTVLRAVSREQKALLDAIRSGAAVVTDGPFIKLTLTRGDNTAVPGDVSESGETTISMVCLSTPEFGELTTVSLATGSPGASSETILLTETGALGHECRRVLSLPLSPGYLRAECRTETGACCLTNPVWIS